MVYELGVADLRFTGNQQLQGTPLMRQSSGLFRAKLWFKSQVLRRNQDAPCRKHRSASRWRDNDIRGRLKYLHELTWGQFTASFVQFWGSIKHMRQLCGSRAALGRFHHFRQRPVVRAHFRHRHRCLGRGRWRGRRGTLPGRRPEAAADGEDLRRGHLQPDRRASRRIRSHGVRARAFSSPPCTGSPWTRRAKPTCRRSSCSWPA